MSIFKTGPNSRYTFDLKDFIAVRDPVIIDARETQSPVHEGDGSDAVRVRVQGNETFLHADGQGGRGHWREDLRLAPGKYPHPSCQPCTETSAAFVRGQRLRAGQVGHFTNIPTKQETDPPQHGQ